MFFRSTSLLKFGLMSLLLVGLLMAVSFGSGSAVADNGGGAGQFGSALGGGVIDVSDIGNHYNDQGLPLQRVAGAPIDHVCQLPISFDPPAAFVPPPTHFGRAPETATINVNYNGSNWTNEARNAFEYAASIWESVLISSVPIEVDANFSPLGSGVLGSAGAEDYYRNFAGGVSNVWYPVALANSLSGIDLNGDTAEISASFSSSFDWYYGTDGNTPFNEVDFVSVVLHEIGHGLGFAGSMYVSGGNGFWLGYPSPFTYDRFTESSGGTSLTSYGNNSGALAGVLQSNGVYFDGSNANAANSGSRVRLYAPSSWQQGSSYSHLDDVFNGTSNSLMTYSVSFGEAEHHPGDVTLGLFADIGWDVALAPSFASDIPDQIVERNGFIDNAVDLYQIVPAAAGDPGYSFSITQGNGGNAGISLQSGRYIDIDPVTNWTGTQNVTVRATNDFGFADHTFRVLVVSEAFEIWVPASLND